MKLVNMYSRTKLNLL
nr:unnamed protein product [Callosobruchus analis]